MYYLVSKNGLRVPMNLDWYEQFEKIKWNENESAKFNDESGFTEIRTIAGKYQGQRIWTYIHLSGEMKDKGVIVEMN